jgi:hypothetical protein
MGFRRTKTQEQVAQWYFSMLCCSSRTGKLYKFKTLLLERMVEKCVTPSDPYYLSLKQVNRVRHSKICLDIYGSATSVWGQREYLFSV